MEWSFYKEKNEIHLRDKCNPVSKRVHSYYLVCGFDTDVIRSKKSSIHPILGWKGNLQTISKFGNSNKFVVESWAMKFVHELEMYQQMIHGYWNFRYRTSNYLGKGSIVMDEL